MVVRGENVRVWGFSPSLVVRDDVPIVFIDRPNLASATQRNQEL